MSFNTFIRSLGVSVLRFLGGNNSYEIDEEYTKPTDHYNSDHYPRHSSGHTYTPYIYRTPRQSQHTQMDRSMLAPYDIRSRTPPRSRSQPRGKDRERLAYRYRRRDSDRLRDRDRERDRERDRQRDRTRERDYRDRDRESHRDVYRERTRDRERGWTRDSGKSFDGDKYRSYAKSRESDRERERPRDHSRKRDREKGSHSDREKREAGGRGDDADGHLIVRKGDMIRDDYKVTSTLGEGTFGKVMACKNTVTNETVAIKIIRNVEKYRSAAEVEIDILEKIKMHDPENKNQIIHLCESFTHQHHVCMVFQLLGLSMFDFLKANDFHPFPVHQIQLMAYQLIRAIHFLHSIKLTHTDLKPENILFMSNKAEEVEANQGSKRARVLQLHKADIQLIDLGSATWEDQHHTRVVSTRHYRAPEVILETQWSYPCDMWSIGCILIELYTGDALFQTHENMEHLAMMEAVLGPLPMHMVLETRKEKYFKDSKLNWPAQASTEESIRFVKDNCHPLEQYKMTNDDPLTNQLFDLISKLLVYDPKERWTAKQAMDHEFLQGMCDNIQ